MARQTITKRAYCKHAVFLQRNDKQTLQSKMTDALGKLRKVGERKEEQGDDQNYVRTVIYHRSAADMLFGILASYERGTHQLTVAEDDEAEVLTVEQVAPPKTDEDKRREFLEGTCYFGLFKNHVVLVSSRSLGAKAAEQHFNWLLDHAGVLGDNNRVGLSDQVTQATRERIEAAHVKEVEIGAPLIEVEEQVSVPDAQGRESQSTVFSGMGLDILRQILGADFLARMKLSDAVDGNIEVSLRVRYKRATNTKAQKVLDNIALAVRNLDEDEVKLTLDGGGVLRGHDLKLSHPLHVEGRDGVPNPDALFDKMHDWLLGLFENHIIEP